MKTIETNKVKTFNNSVWHFLNDIRVYNDDIPAEEYLYAYNFIVDYLLADAHRAPSDKLYLFVGIDFVFKVIPAVGNGYTWAFDLTIDDEGLLCVRPCTLADCEPCDYSGNGYRNLLHEDIEAVDMEFYRHFSIDNMRKLARLLRQANTSKGVEWLLDFAMQDNPEMSTSCHVVTYDFEEKKVHVDTQAVECAFHTATDYILHHQRDYGFAISEG